MNALPGIGVIMLLSICIFGFWGSLGAAAGFFGGMLGMQLKSDMAKKYGWEYHNPVGGWAIMIMMPGGICGFINWLTVSYADRYGEGVESFSMTLQTLVMGLISMAGFFHLTGRKYNS